MERTLFDLLASITAQYRVRAYRTYAVGAFLHHHGGCLGKGTCGIDHIVEQDHILAHHIADHRHLLDLIGHFALLVAYRHVHTEMLGVSAGALGTARIRCCDQQIRQVHLLDVR